MIGDLAAICNQPPAVAVRAALLNLADDAAPLFPHHHHRLPLASLVVAHLRDRILHLCADEELRREVGRADAVYVAENLGAAERVAEVVVELLEGAAGSG